MSLTFEGTRGILNPRAGGAHFALARHAPAPDLAHVVKRHWVVAWDLRGRPPFVQEVLPHPCVNLVIEPGRAAAHGVSTQRTRHLLAGTGVVVGTKFRPGGFAGLLPGPVCALTERWVALEEAFGEEGAALAREADALGRDVGARIAAVEAFVRRRLPAPSPAGELVREAVEVIARARAGTRVPAVAEAVGVSPRTLQRVFRERVGVGPKWVLQRHRVHEAAERMAAGERQDWAALALELGYFDQAHFIREFRALVGCPPAAYAEACARAAARAGLAA